MKKLILTFFCFLLLMSAANAAQPEINPDAICIPVQILKQDGDVLDLGLELAVTPAATRRGLMFREFLPLQGGMLFVFTPPYEVAMWMKNTLIPLDMLFISPDYRILNIHENAIPHDLRPLPAAGKAQYVIELNGGAARANNIKAGDQIKLPEGFFNFQ